MEDENWNGGKIYALDCRRRRARFDIDNDKDDEYEEEYKDD